MARLPRRKAVVFLLIVALLWMSLVGPGPQTARALQIIIITPIFTPRPTATRTPTPINVGNFVWDDLDADGRQDAGEPGMAGVTVQLWNSTKTQLIASAVTNANGNYTVVAPLPGQYRLRVLLPGAADSFSPINQGADDTGDSDVNPSGINLGFTDIYTFGSNLISITSIDAGIRRFRTPTPTRTPTPINIGNFIWDDLDADGIQDAGEPGLAGITVQLWNSTKTQLIASAVTNASGNYTVVAPLPGDYRVRVVLLNVNDQFSPKDQGADNTKDSDINPSGTDLGFTDVFNIASNVISMTNMDAGIRRFKTPTPTRTPTPINVGNLVWHDLDSDGIQDAGEPGVPGVTVQLWNGAKTQLIASTATNASGIYTLVAPLPGEYRVRVLLPTGASFSPKDQGADDTRDSDITSLIISVDYGFTSIYTFASNLISIVSIDAGMRNVPDVIPTPTQTIAPTQTNVPAPTETNVPAPTATWTSAPTATWTPVLAPTLTPTRTATPSRTPTGLGVGVPAGKAVLPLVMR